MQNVAIARPRYLKQLKDRMQNGLVKVVTGIRRCGKSFLLFNLFRDYLLEIGVEEDHIVEVRLDENVFAALRDPNLL